MPISCKLPGMCTAHQACKLLGMCTLTKLHKNAQTAVSMKRSIEVKTKKIEVEIILTHFNVDKIFNIIIIMKS